jgi:hypothetical protein
MKHPTLVACVLAAACFVVARQAGAAAPRDCKTVRGMIVPDCNAAICNQGRVTGDLSGTFTSKVTSIYPVQAQWRFTGWTRIELDDRRGMVETLDAGTTPKDARGGPDLSKSAEVRTLNDATGRFQDYDGTLIVDGAYAAGRPTAYSGEFCRR